MINKKTMKKIDSLLLAANALFVEECCHALKLEENNDYSNQKRLSDLVKNSIQHFDELREFLHSDNSAEKSE